MESTIHPGHSGEASSKARAHHRQLRVIVLMATSSPWSRLVATSLAARGAAVHVVDFSSDGASEFLSSQDDSDAVSELAARVERVHRIRMPQSPIVHAVRAAGALRSIARACGPDLVLTLYGGTSALVALLSGVRPFVVYVVGSDVLRADWIRRATSRLTLGRAARVVANGKHLAQSAQRMSPRAHVENLYLGIDLARFPPRRHATVNPRFVCTRVFRPVYDNATIIRALALLDRVPPGFQMTFLSAGSQLAEAQALADQVIAPAWRDQVRFAGWTSDQSLDDALQAASFYLSASLSDGTSSSLLEAMASGLIPIVSDIPANREWIVHGENGLLFPPGDHVALARCIELVLRGPSWMASALSHNHRMVAERADALTNMTLLSEILLDVRQRAHDEKR